jgi:hypothetical protein
MSEFADAWLTGMGVVVLTALSGGLLFAVYALVVFGVRELRKDAARHAADNAWFQTSKENRKRQIRNLENALRRSTDEQRSAERTERNTGG